MRLDTLPYTGPNVPELLGKKPELKSLGRLADKEGFSASCSAFSEQRKNIDLYVAFKDNAYHLAHVPPQFHEAFNMAAEDQFALRGVRRNAMVYLSQGILQPGENFRVVRPHIDPVIRHWPINIGDDSGDEYAVSDKLTTMFMDQAFKVPEYQFSHMEDIQWRLCDLLAEQIDPESRVVPQDYEMMRCGPYAVHEAQLPLVETSRTFMLTRFIN